MLLLVLTLHLGAVQDAPHSVPLRVALALVLGLGAAACGGVPAGAEPGDRTTAAAGEADIACRDDAVRQATGAPAEGIWLYDGSGQHRVAAIVGPAQVVAGEAQVTRRVETVEARPGADTIRYASDTAAVRLQLIAPAARPAAVYSVGPLVLLAAYEPCNPGPREPLIRYLRLDPGGRIATDVMLRRESARP